MIKEAIISLLIGFLIGRLIHLNNTLLIEDLETLVLYGLIFVVGLGISIDESLPKKFRELSLETLIAPISSIIGTLMFGFLMSYVLGIQPKVTLSIVAGFGWYTFTGPVLFKLLGIEAGILGFLSNLFRELFTMILSPILGKKFGASAIIASGGATSMDTTLPFIIRYSGIENSLPSIISGTLLTLLAALLVPFFASF
ncbi:MAG: lysine exporter LysO family protein [Thermoprotei archaeon]